MNGHPPPSGPPALPAITNGQPPVARRPRPKPGGALRAPRRPLKSVSRVKPEAKTQAPAQETARTLEPEAHAESRRENEALKQQYLAQGATVFPLVATRRELKELRHHVMRMQTLNTMRNMFPDGVADIQNPEQFTPPIRLHRRDPRAPPSGAGSHFEEEETKEDLEETKERERIELQKEERRKMREENQAKIAPTGKSKGPAFQKKTEQKWRPDDTPEAKKRQLLRYEETLPWHLEDFENKQTWVGTYESELSGSHVMLSTDPNNPLGAVRLAPMERWYRFNAKHAVKSTEDFDSKPIKAEKLPKFLAAFEEKGFKREKEEERFKARNGLSTRIGGGADDEGRIRRDRNDDGGGQVKREADADDIDFNLEEDFADDEEGLNGLFEGDQEEVKEAEDKLKRDQLAAALWDRPDEAELTRKEEEEKQEAEEVKEMEKIYRKSLAKREKQYEYIDSDPENPYVTESDSDTDSETERLRAKEEEEKKALEANGKASDTTNLPSASSTKGTNTPSGTHNNKALDIKGKKRPGSPNLSEASGNESSRKKHKKNRDKLPAGSDSDVTDASKAKKKDKKKSRLVIGASPAGSPGASRAGSPAASQVNGGSRAGSPSASSPRPGMPSAKEIYDSLPAGGMKLGQLTANFKGRVDKSNTLLFISLVKAVSSFDKGNSWLTPLAQMPSEEQIQATLKNGAKATKAVSG